MWASMQAMACHQAPPRLQDPHKLSPSDHSLCTHDWPHKPVNEIGDAFFCPIEGGSSMLSPCLIGCPQKDWLCRRRQAVLNNERPTSQHACASAAFNTTVACLLGAPLLPPHHRCPTTQAPAAASAQLTRWLLAHQLWLVSHTPHTSCQH